MKTLITACRIAMAAVRRCGLCPVRCEAANARRRRGLAMQGRRRAGLVRRAVRTYQLKPSSPSGAWVIYEPRADDGERLFVEPVR